MLTALSLRPYVELTRLNKPIGILLLLWPTCWALWLAAKGIPPSNVLAIFLAGVVLMRSAGCIINDIFDRHFDRHVARTRLRPLAAGTITVTNALILAALLALTAFLLVLFCNRQTILLSFAGAFFAASYPLLKRITHLPQLGLGVAFSWGVPMAFAAVTGAVTASAWLVFAAAAVWPVIYDTMYAMTDRADDVKAGVKSTAILFDKYDVMIIAMLMVCFLMLLTVVGLQFGLSFIYYGSLLFAAILFLRQLSLIRLREPAKCFQAFKENNYVGLAVFLGIVFSSQG
jgi:4-hydroxybenzoate polyprenyltransferase